MRARPRTLLGWVAALLATFAMAAPASAQVMTITGATPTTFSGPGEVITFHLSLRGSNAITEWVELTRINRGAENFSCAGLPLDVLGSTTCTFTYTTQPLDVFSINQFGTFRVTDPNGTTRTRNIANTYTVPYVPVPPTASITAATSSVTEDGAQSLSYTVTLSDPAAAPISVYFSLGGSATTGIDYAASANPLVIATGTTTGTITIDPTGDATVEADETVDVSLVAGSGYTLGAPASATGTIANDDVPSLSINDVSMTEGNAGTTNASFTVSLSQPAGPGGVSFDIATANGTASAGTDYAANGLTGQTIPAGSSTYNFTVQMNGDTLNEPNETFIVNVSNVMGATVADAQGLGTIIDDDVLPSLSINSVSVNEGNAGNVSITFTVTLSAASGQSVSVNYATANGTATAGSDYTAASGTLTFSPGQTSQTVAVQVAGDTTVEPNETFSVGLSGPTNASIATATGTGTIVNDDVAVTLNPTTLPNATVAAAYSQTLTASGGNGGPYSFAVTAGALPAGLNLSSGGVLSGMPTAGGTFNFTITAIDLASNAGSQAYALVVAVTVPGVPTIGTATAGNTQASVTFTAPGNNGGAAITSYTVSSSPGNITGTGASSPIVVTGLTNGIAYSFKVTASNSAGTGAASDASNIVTPKGNQTITFNNPGAQNFGTSPTLTATATSSLTPTFSSITSGVCTITSGGALTFLTTGNCTIHADQGGNNAYLPAPTVTQSFTVNAPAPVVTSVAPNTGSTAGGTAVTITGSSFAGATAVRFGATNAIGFTVASATSIIATAPSGSAGSVDVTVTTAGGTSATGAQSGFTYVAPPVAGGVSAAVAYGSGVNPIPLNITGGTPSSVAIATGSVHGTATASGISITYTPVAGFAGSDSFTYTASNLGGTSAPATVTLTVNSPTLEITASQPLSADAGNAYTQTFSWSGGASPYSGYSVTGLPAGLSVTGTTANSVTLSGTPTAAGSFNLDVSATDSSSGTGPFTKAQTFTLTVDAPTLVLSPAAGVLPLTYAAVYSQTFSTSGGNGPYSYSLSGTLPAGVSFNAATGTLSGTPTEPGSFPVNVTATDNSTGVGAPFSITQSYALQVATPTIVLTPATLLNPVAGTAYSQTITANGGVAPYDITMTAGSLPTGITLTTGGVLSGTSFEIGTFNFTVTATDAHGQTGSHAYSVTIAGPTLTLTPTAGTLTLAYGAAYSQAFTAGGSPGPYSYVQTGALPTGVTFSGDTLSGTPTVSGSYSITVTASDTGLTGAGAPFSITQNYTLDVPTPILVVDPATLPGTTAGLAYSENITATGGVAPYGFTVTSGALPTGLTLSSGGVLSGTTTASGTFTFTVTATDTHGQTAARAYTVVVAVPTLTLDPGTLPNGTASAAYSQTVSANGGIAPYSYALSSGALPVGLTFANGVLSGTPTSSGSFVFDITATDSTSGTAATVTHSYTLVIAAPTLALNPGTLLDGIAGTAYSQTLTISGGIAPYTATLTGSLPTGLSFNPATHTLSGTPTQSGTFNLSAVAIDSTGGSPATVTNAYVLTIAAPTLTLTPPAGALTLSYGAVYSQAFTAGGSPGPYSYVLSGALPTGVTFSGDTLSGTPTVPGSYPITVTATDTGLTGVGAPFSITQNYTLNVPTPTLVVDPATLPGTTAGLAYNASITATGGVAPYSFTVTSGAVPTGLTLGSDGVLSGITTASATFNFTATATDTHGQIASRAYTVVVAVPTLALDPGTLPDGIAGTAYSQTLTASGGIAPYSYALSSGALPAGLTFANGVFSGAPTASGSFSFDITATDSTGGVAATTTRSYTLVIAAATLSLDPASLLDGIAGTAYSQTVSASGGIAPYSYALSGGALPAGLTFANGELSGTPAASGSFSFDISASDSTGGTAATVTRSYTLVIAAATLTLTPGTLPDGIAGATYSQVLTISGGIAPYTAALTGSLPAGLSFNPATHALSGTPTQSGTFNLSVVATDSTGGTPATATNAYVLTIAAATLSLDPGTLPNGIAGTAYSQTVSASGGIAPYSYALSSGALPTGLTFANGALSGTPTVSGSFTFDITATDSTGGSAATMTHSYTLVITAATLMLTPGTLPDGIAGATYSQALTISGGIAPYTAALTGSLPAGLSFNPATHALSGTPTQSGTFNLSVVATDSTGGTPATATNAYVLTIAAATLSLDPGTLPNGIAGTAYNQTVLASGGIAPYTYALSSGALPAGLSFANGVLSGAPTASGSFSFDITASDSTGGTPAATTRSYTLVVAAATLSLDPASLPAGVAGTAYSQTLTASGGIAPYSYALSGGALPAGLSFDNGVLSGTPTVSGSFTFDITASDSTGGTAATVTRNFTLTIAAPVITITPATLPDGVRGSAYSQALSASGGTAAYAFALSGGALPAGIALASDGTLAGTPTADGNFSFAVSVTDALGFTATTNYTWVVAMDPPAVVDDAVTGLGGAVTSIPVTANDTGAITSIAIVAAPAHGIATVDALVVAYTPEAGFSGADSFRYTATGPGGTSTEATVKVTVNPLPVAASRKLTANAGVAMEVDLTEGASGGPFTAATIVSLSPANAGTATIAQTGSGDAARYILTYTPAAAFSGLATLRFTLANAYATSAEATLEFDVTARPDPSQDPEVRALLSAQAAATRRFATAQINNFQQRLENMHGDGDSRFSNQVSFSADRDRDCENQVGRIPGRSCEHRARNDEVAHAAAAPADAGNPQDAVFGTWIGGVIRSGNHDGRGGNAGIDFESDGLSVGADYRLNRKFAFGAGLGWGRDDSDVGEQGSRSEGKAYTAALYASFHPGDRLFVDGLMGYQDLSYDLRRYVTSNGALVQGARDGTQWFASLSAGADIRHGEHLQLTPYARLDLARATLDAYTERGDPLYSLRYADMDVDTTTGNLGLRVDYRYKLSRGLFSPQLRLEYQHDFQGNGDATMGYADQLSGPFYRTGVEIFDRNRFVLGLGAQFSTDGGLSTRIEYRGVVGDGEDSDHGLMLNIEKRY